MVPMGTFCFVTLTLRTPPMEIGELLGYISHNWFSLTHVLFFGTIPFFTGGKIVNFGQHFRQGLELAAYLLLTVCACVCVCVCYTSMLQITDSEVARMQSVERDRFLYLVICWLCYFVVNCSIVCSQRSTRRTACAGISCRRVCVCVSVCHTPVLNQNFCTDWADFLLTCFSRLILPCVLEKFGYLQNMGISLWNFVPNSELRKCRHGTPAVGDSKRYSVDSTWRVWSLHGRSPIVDHTGWWSIGV